MWEEEVVGECSTLIHNIVLQVDEVDRWQWMLDPFKGYLDSDIYRMLIIVDYVVSNIIWHITVPLKAFLFVWRLLRNRISTSDNLLMWSAIQQDLVHYVSSCGLEESVDHLFMRYNFFGSNRHTVQHWIGIVAIELFLLSGHFLQFVQLGCFSKMICVYLSDLERNK